MARRNDKDGLYKRTDSQKWWASYTDSSGKRIRRSTGTENRKEAEALLAKWKLQAFQERQWDAPGELVFEEVLNYFLNERKSKRSHRDDLLHTKRLRESLTGVDMRSLTPTDIREHIARRKNEGVSDATINREQALLSAAINLYNRDFSESLPNPTKGRKLKEPEPRIRWIKKQEAETLIAEAEKSLRAHYLADFIRLALHTGCRSQEMLGLEWSRVDLESRMILLEGQHTKTAKRRSVPLNKVAYQALVARKAFRDEHCPDSPWVFCSKAGERIASVKTSFATARDTAKITNFRIHDLRHTCAAWLTSAGRPLEEIRDLLGHSSITMTEKYAHLAPDNVKRAVDALDR